MNIRAVRILEITWLIVAILSIIAGMHKTYQHGFGKSYLFFIISFISFLMYFYRRNMRMKTKGKSKNLKL